MKYPTKEYAIKHGLMRYYGKPCKKCKHEWYSVSQSHCIECNRTRAHKKAYGAALDQGHWRRQHEALAYQRELEGLGCERG